MIDRHHGWNTSFKPLMLGFVLSLALTIAAFRLDMHYHLPPMTLMYALFGLATLQVIFQLVFYFHLGLESKPAWNLITFLFVAAVVVIIIGGSIWIMDNLSYNVMPTESPTGG